MGPLNSTSVVIPEKSEESDIRHVEVTKDMMVDELDTLGAFISRIDFRFAGTVAPPRFTNDMPCKRASCTGTDGGTKERTTLIKSVSGVDFR